MDFEKKIENMQSGIDQLQFERDIASKEQNKLSIRKQDSESDRYTTLKERSEELEREAVGLRQSAELQKTQTEAREAQNKELLMQLN